MDQTPTIVLVDKPKGMTSFKAVQYIRQKYRAKKAGHTGTLDPLASGLLVIGINDGTKQLRHIVNAQKVYEAEICIGEKSATGDAEGPIIERMRITSLKGEDIARELVQMIGVQRLPVSMYSAMKRGGEALYKKARRGEKVILPLRDMEVYSATLLDDPYQRGETVHFSVRVTVGSGTYVRSLAEELGRRLGYPARLENLRRTEVGTFSVKNAFKIPNN